MAYNRRTGHTIQDQLKVNGGVKRSTNVKFAGQESATEIPDDQQEKVRVYRPHQATNLGPLGVKPPNYTFYDLMLTPGDEGLRGFFEDYVFPEVALDGQRPIMLPVRDIARGGSIPKGSGYDRSMERYTMTQYIYALLNPSKNLVQSFGMFPGMEVSRTHYLVCVEVGDPATGYLGNAFVQYALALNTPIRSCVEQATAEREPGPEGGFAHFFRVVGDKALEKEIFDRWFNTDEYYFNSVVYPKIRALSEYSK